MAATQKQHDTKAIDVGYSPGISAELANTARSVLLTTTILPVKGKPVTFISHTPKTRAASNEFLQCGEKAEIARILGIAPTEVQKRFRGSQPGISNAPSYTIKPGRTDYTYTILALGDLSYENGLPALGNSKEKYSLKSGEALHFIGDLEQTYSATGGGTLIWFHWSNLPEQPLQ